MKRLLCVSALVAGLVCPQWAQAAFDSADAAKAAGQPLQILRVTPEGDDVPAGKQVVIQFNRPVVPLGRMERTAEELPIKTEPQLACEWRWINTSALACNLPDNDPLRPSTRYSIDIQPGIKAEDGMTIEQPYQASFITQRPRVSYKEFRQWRSPGLPVIRLVFDQPVDQESVAEHVFLAVGDNGKRTPLNVNPDPKDREQPQIVPAPGESYALVFKKQPPQKSDDDVHRADGREARRVWLLEPQRELPLDTHVVLKVEPGLDSAYGSEKSADSSEIVQFDTYPAFSFLGITCTSNDAKQIVLNPGDAPDKKCNPMDGVQLMFSAPVERDQLGKMMRFSPPVGGWTNAGRDDFAEAPENADGTDQSERLSYLFREPHTHGKNYSVWLPGGLKAAQIYTIESRSHSMNMFERFWHWLKSLFVKTQPIEVRDLFGRELGKPIYMQFATDHRNPNIVLDYHDAVLEKGVDSEVPLYVNNLDSFSFSYMRTTPKGDAAGQVFTQALPSVKDVQYATKLGVRGMVGEGSGAVYGTLSTQPPIPGMVFYPRLFAQVTPYQLHFKLGHFSSLVWVTDMASGAPVEGASVSLYEDALTTLHLPEGSKAKATTDANGIAVLPGTDVLDPDLKITRRYEDGDTRYFLRITKGEDMALLPVSDNFQINSYRSSGSESVWPSNKLRYGHMRAWGTTAQGIYRAGDTIQYKLYVRNQDDHGFIAPPLKGYRLKIVDPMGKVVHQVKDVALSPFGGFSGEFTVPKEGAVGWYQFKLVADFATRAGDEYDASPETEGDSADQGDASAEEQNSDDSKKKILLPMRVLVSDFTPASFHVSNQLNGDLFHEDEKVNVTTRAELHSGGAYTDASARVTATLDSRMFVSKHPLAQGFRFDSYESEMSSQQLFQKIEALNDKGELALEFPISKPNIVYGRLTVESAVQDDRGKYISAQSGADYIGVDRLVGLRQTEWLYHVGKPAKMEYLVVDDHGAPVKDVPVSITIEHQVTTSAPVKGAGNAYLTEYHNEWKPASECKGNSAAEAAVCDMTLTEAGTYRATATIQDTKGREHKTTENFYAVGKDFVVWNDENDNGLTIIPESTSYKVGDTARYLVKNPYPGAKALITIERYGVIDRFVQNFDSSTPVVEFPVKPDYLPGFYLSVVVVSPRVDKPLGEGQVDLGKPAFRMGYVTVPVKDPYKEMLVTAKTDRDSYKPRDKVTLTLHAEPRMKDKAEPVELTVAVLDESVFDLIAGGKSYFDPYAGFYKLESLDLRNYSLLSRLVGRQKFETKGANPGGDGGADLAMRSLFKFVSYWNGQLQTDKDGNATVSFDAPDNLTGWRVLAIATTPGDRFGLGDANFKVNRPTEVRPVMPNQVMEGDSFDAGFSVMNRTDKPREIAVSIKAEGDGESEPVSRTVVLEPYKRTTVFLPVKASALPLDRDRPQGEIRFTVTAGDALDSDGLKHSLPVHKRRSLDVAANYGTTTQNRVEEPVLFPQAMLPDVGSVSVVASPTVIGNVAGAFTYIRDYPYLCWEQRLTKGVMAAHYKNLKSYLPNSLTWPQAETLPRETLQSAASFQAPNGGMAYFVAQDQYADPYLSAYTAIAFNWLRKSGYAIPEEVQSKLDTYLDNLLRNDAVPDFYSEGMTSTVRAVALAALAERGKLSAADVERYRPHVPKMSLFGKAHYLQAALHVQGEEAAAHEAAKMILAMSNQTGGKFVFNETWDDSYSRILASPIRENCAVLDAFTAYGETTQDAPLVGDVPFKLVRAITQDRKNRDHWENTQENIFCMNALIDFARIYEKDKPAMSVKASMDGQPFGQASFKDVRDAAATLERPVKQGDAGRKAQVVIERNGAGRLYYATRLAYALPIEQTKPANAGIEIHREYSVERNGKWELLASPALVRRGELVRVDLYLSVPAARDFVVVDDPVAGGLEPVNRDLATASEVDAKKGDFVAADGSFFFKFSDWIGYGVSRWSFYHQELRHDAVRFYSDYLSPGNYHLSYSAQAIATGTFSALPTMAQEMYDPDVYGKTDALSLKVEEQPKQ